MKSKVENNTRDFLKDFFENSKIIDKNGVMKVSEVPKDFESFVGKKSPYIFVFDIDTHNRVKDSDLIMQGSYFLLAIRDYLQDKGQTSLLQLNFSPDKIEISKKIKKEIKEIKKEDKGFFYEFYFVSNYQYLNDKKQFIKKILIKDNKKLDLNLKLIKSQKGNPAEINFSNSLESYNVAKKILEKNLMKDTHKIKLKLNEKLKKELNRIEDHYYKQIKEKDEEVENCAKKISMLQSKLKHTSYERDINILKRMIRESETRLSMLKQKGYLQRLKDEEEFHIKDEIEKHALTIKHHLINVTVYYYPLFNLTILSNGKKKILKYDPILEKII